MILNYKEPYRILYWWTISPVTLAYDIERSVFEPSRTKDMSSIQFTVFKRPLNQIEQIKSIRIEKKKLNAIFSKEFDWVRSSNGVELFTEKHEWNKIVQIQRWNSQGDLKFCFFHYSQTCM